MSTLRTHAKVGLLLLGCLLAGALGVLVMLGALELYKDLSFLHAVRKATEQQQRSVQAPPPVQPPAPVKGP